MARREFQMPSVLRYEGRRPYWYIRYRRKVLVERDQIEREEKWHKLGYCNEISKREAQRLRDGIMRDVNREVYTLQSQVRFRDFVTVYKEQHVVTLAPGPRQKYLSLLNNHIIPAFGKLRLCDIGTQEIQALINAKAVEGLSWWTRKDIKGIISGIFTKAEDWGYWERRNPARRVSLGRKRQKRPKRILNDDQLRELLAAVPLFVRLMVELAVSTSMRISEILGLKWRCVDLERGLVHVEERYYRGDTDEPKSERSRRSLPLGYLTEALRRHKPSRAPLDDYVFHKGGEPLDDRAILRDHIRPATKRLGFYFEGFGWHSFRRQHLTLIQEEGATAFEAQAQAGHSRPVMTSEYTIVGLERREQAVRRVQERLLGGTVSNAVN